MLGLGGESRAINIREAKSSDLEEIIKMEKVSLAGSRKGQIKEQYWLFSSAILRLRSVVLVAESENNLVGYITGIVVDEHNWTRGYICDLYVEEEYRRKRAAVHMMDEIILKMKELGAQVFFTNSIKNNSGFLQFALSSGFTDITAQEFYSLVEPRDSKNV